MRISTLHATTHIRCEEGKPEEKWADVMLWYGDAYICCFRSDDWWDLCVGPNRDLVLDEFIAGKMRTLLRAPA